jgi:DNA-binding response OmpR family regulator
MNHTSKHVLTTTADSTAGSGGKSPHILVVDDDRVLLDLLQKVLKKFGFEVAPADSGKGAIGLIQEFVPDVVLLDIKMPGMDGLTLLKEIKARDPDTEVIVMTGFASLDSAVEALKYGASDYIKKPFDRLAHVVDAIRRAWERRRPRLERRNLRTSLERTIYELKVLYSVSRVIGCCSDQKEITVRVLETLSQIISYDVAIFVLGEGSDPEELSLQVVNPSSSGFIEEAKRSLLEAFNLASPSKLSADGAFHRVMGKKNVRTGSSAGQEDRRAHRIARNLNSFLNVPLMSNGNLVGMVNLSSHLDRAFGPDDIRLIYTVSSQMHPAIQRLKGMKAAERTRIDRLAGSISEGIIMIDENLELVLANGAAQGILGVKDPDIKTLQSLLGLDLKRFKAESEKGIGNVLIQPKQICSVTYEIDTSVIRDAAGTFLGFMIRLRKPAT